MPFIAVNKATGERVDITRVGYPYKRWRLIDATKAKDVLSSHHIRPMRPTAMEKWQVQP